MNENKTLGEFENKQIRRYYDLENQIWYFSLVDIVEALTDSTNPTDYLKKIRKRDPELHLYIGKKCPQVTLLTKGKNRKTLAKNARKELENKTGKKVITVENFLKPQKISKNNNI